MSTTLKSYLRTPRKVGYYTLQPISSFLSQRNSPILPRILFQLGFYCCSKHCDQRVYFSSQLQSIMKEVRAGTQRHELQERPQKSASYCLIPGATLSLLLQNPGPPAWRWHYPQWSGPTHINHQLRKYPHTLAYRKILCSHFSTEFLLCPYKKTNNCVSLGVFVGFVWISCV